MKKRLQVSCPFLLLESSLIAHWSLIGRSWNPLIRLDNYHGVFGSAAFIFRIFNLRGLILAPTACHRYRGNFNSGSIRAISALRCDVNIDMEVKEIIRQNRFG